VSQRGTRCWHSEENKSPDYGADYMLRNRSKRFRTKLSFYKACWIVIKKVMHVVIGKDLINGSRLMT